MTTRAGADGCDAIVALHGDIDMATTPGLGLSVLVRAHRRLSRNGGALVLRSPNSSVRRVIEITGLNQVLAIESCAPGAPNADG